MAFNSAMTAREPNVRNSDWENPHGLSSSTLIYKNQLSYCVIIIQANMDMMHLLPFDSKRQKQGYGTQRKKIPKFSDNYTSEEVKQKERSKMLRATSSVFSPKSGEVCVEADEDNY